MTDDKVVKLPVPAAQQAKGADEHARADTERNQRLFDWADAVFKKLGLDKAVAAAKSIEVLRGITLDLTNIEIPWQFATRSIPRAASARRRISAASKKAVLSRF
jgi:hypothetical protein